VARILIINDDELMRGFLRELFTREGFTIREAQDGAAGIQAFKDEASDAVITDLYMPEADGIEVLREIRKESKEVKIVAISGGTTGGGRTDILQVMQDLGVDRTLQKPFKPEEMVSLVKELLA
tara:strand:- start:20067 stop:20435 length:369 start_codon:yes stop_codon:yes gene_type:complete